MTISDDDLAAIPDSVAELFASLTVDDRVDKRLLDLADRLAALHQPRFEPGDEVWVRGTIHEVGGVDGPAVVVSNTYGGWVRTVPNYPDDVRTAGDFRPPPPDHVIEWAGYVDQYRFDDDYANERQAAARWLLDYDEATP